MFGGLRLFLAFFVVFSHLVGSPYLAHFGFYAVRGFFVLSGYLMTLGLNEHYGFDARRFWVNRLLRLLPLYYAACLLTLVAVALLPGEAATYIGQWQPNLMWRDALADVLVLPLNHVEPQYRLVPTAWSLAVEIEMYVVLFLFISRSKKQALMALFFGLLYHAVCGSNDVAFGYRFFGAFSAVLPFSFGALIYFYRKDGMLTNIAPAMAGVALAIWVIDALASETGYIDNAGYYTDTILFSVVVAGLANAKFSPPIRSVDRALGELAYPVFLVQWLTGFVTALVFMPGVWRGWSLALANIPLTLIVAAGLAVLNRMTIEPIRERVRGTPVDRCFAADAPRYQEPAEAMALPAP
jgi:peptidoglycan/LPS O-acetylase OafA/YrhL